MASYTSLFTGLTGLSVHARKLDVIGNNIANTNTTAYKTTRMLFESNFTRDFRLGSPPGTFSGGVNPTQIGLGVNIAGTQRNFTNGGFTPTGDPRDLSIDGRGFFVVENNGQRLFTRAGSFRQDLDNNLVTIDGGKLQGYGVDDNFNLVEGTMTDINIPIGGRTIAEASTSALVAGNLNASGDIPTQGASISLGADALGAGFTAITSGVAVVGGTLLTDFQDPSAGAGTPLYSVGQTIQITGAEKGGRELADAELEITATTTLDDLMAFMTEALGLHSTGSANPDGLTPGVTVDAAGLIQIVGNVGTESDLLLEVGDIATLDAAGSIAGNPYVPTKSESADGESVSTKITVFDSLGSIIEVDVTMVIESTATNGPVTWRYFLESPDDSDLDLRLGNGTIQFDSEGQLTTQPEVTVAVDRAGTGAQTPLTFTLNFAGDAGRTTSLEDQTSTLVNLDSDGFGAQTLQSFSVGSDGLITGIFSQGAVRTLGQVVIASFTNEAGLVDVGGSYFNVGANSGPAVLTVPGQLSSGGIVPGALELSNVDLGQEFIDLILTQTGYSASTRIIQTADELMQQLLVLGR